MGQTIQFELRVYYRLVSCSALFKGIAKLLEVGVYAGNPLNQ